MLDNFIQKEIIASKGISLLVETKAILGSLKRHGQYGLLQFHIGNMIQLLGKLNTV